jgi:hypothetical protein
MENVLGDWGAVPRELLYGLTPAGGDVNAGVDPAGGVEMLPVRGNWIC